MIRPPIPDPFPIFSRTSAGHPILDSDDRAGVIVQAPVVIPKILKRQSKRASVLFGDSFSKGRTIQTIGPPGLARREPESPTFTMVRPIPSL